MQRVIITLMNMFDADNDLFSLLALPDKIVKDDFLMRLMVECGEMEVFITSPTILKQAIGAWSRSMLEYWQRIANILDLEYNPIWNVDADINHEDQRNIGREYGRGRTIDSNEESETIGTISADNSEAWSNDTKTNYTEEQHEEENINDTENTDDAGSYHDRRTGNIGVTTTQKMMSEELEFWHNYDLYAIIIQGFKKEFCLLIY